MKQTLRPTAVTPLWLALRSLLALTGLAIIVFAWWMVIAGQAGLERRELSHEGVPVSFLLPADASNAPGVVLVHGFAGSARLMTTWALDLAHAGFVVALPDLSGHANNRAPLDWWNDPGQFARDVNIALELLARQPEVDNQRLALIGHSLGSGAVIDASVDPPLPVRAVVAVSPGQSEVSPGHPPNLLLMAGAWEGPFLEAARTLLADAGGEGGDMKLGNARRLEVIPASEHIGVLFSPVAHAASTQWLASALEFQTRPRPEQHSTPMLGWVLNLLGVLMIWGALAPLLPLTRQAGPVPGRRIPQRPVSGPVVQERGVRRPSMPAGRSTMTARSAAGLPHPAGRIIRSAALASVAATVCLIGIGELINLDGLGGILVSPQFSLWLALAGCFWLAMGPRPRRPAPRDALLGLLMLTVLVLAFGVMGAMLWLPWWPALHRLPYLPVLGLLIFPWALALAASLAGHRGWRGLMLGAALTVITMICVGIAAWQVDGMMFLLIILPLLPVMLALPLWVSRRIQRPWADALALSSFLAWTLTILFPLI